MGLGEGDVGITEGVVEAVAVPLGEREGVPVGVVLDVLVCVEVGVDVDDVVRVAVLLLVSVLVVDGVTSITHQDQLATAKAVATELPAAADTEKVKRCVPPVGSTNETTCHSGSLCPSADICVKL